MAKLSELEEILNRRIIDAYLAGLSVLEITLKKCNQHCSVKGSIKLKNIQSRLSGLLSKRSTSARCLMTRMLVRQDAILLRQPFILRTSIEPPIGSNAWIQR